MKIENEYNWAVIIESIIKSHALKEYNKCLESFILSTKEEYEQELEKLWDKKQRITEELNSKLLAIPFIAILLKYLIHLKIKKCNQEIENLINNHNSNIKKRWRVVWKEILIFYHCDKKCINSEHFKNWQDDFITNYQLLLSTWKGKFIENRDLLFEKLQGKDNDSQNCDLSSKFKETQESLGMFFKLIGQNFDFLLKNWQNQNNLLEICESLLEKWKDQNKSIENCNLLKEISKYCFLIFNGKKLCDIVKNLVTDVCSDFEFQKLESLNIVGNNQFLEKNITKENENSKSLKDTNWNQDVKTECNASTANINQFPSSKSTILRCVTKG